MTQKAAVIDYDLLANLCSIHCTLVECAAMLKVDTATIQRHLLKTGQGSFTDFFDKHSSEGKVSLRRAQYEKAVKQGSVPMQIWLGKQWLGQKDREEVNENLSNEAILAALVAMKTPNVVSDAVEADMDFLG